MRNTLGALNVGGSVRYNNIFSRDIDRHLTHDIRVVINLLERRPCQTKAVEHALMLRAVLYHPLRKLVIHIRLHTLGGFHFIFVFFPKDLHSDWASGGECLAHSLCLEPNSSFRKDCREHTASAVPRVSALFILEAYNIQTLNKGVRPIFPAVDVCIYIPNKLVGDMSKRVVF